jgi:UDP-glucose 4-epimerase
MSARKHLGWTPEQAEIEAIVSSAYRWHQANPPKSG